MLYMRERSAVMERSCFLDLILGRDGRDGRDGIQGLQVRDKIRRMFGLIGSQTVHYSFLLLITRK